MISKLTSRGVLYSAGIVINRVIPEFLFRARVFCVFRFGRPDASKSLASYDDGIRFQWCESELHFGLARQLTYFQPVESPDQHSPDQHSTNQHSTSQHSPYRACLAFDGEVAVGGVWFASDSFEESELGLQIQLQPQQHWLFAANVAKSHRRRGIYGRMLRYVLHTVGNDGDGSEVLASINPTNKASIAAHHAMIDETLGTCVAARILSIAVCRSGGQLKTTRAIGLRKDATIMVG